MENKELEAIKEKYADFIASLSDEDKAKVDACTSPEELIALAQNSEGELPDDVVEAVAGGGGKGSTSVSYECPRCQSTSLSTTSLYDSGPRGYESVPAFICQCCGYLGVSQEFAKH
ncbi:MAG: hypothetical protein IK093_05590 [Ruminiclostridium sp.]|nr:hypothetical protein [Ruminiclostridium sp.]